VYHTADWAGLWEDSFAKFRARFIVCSDADGYLAGLPLALRGRRPLARAFSLPMGTYGGLIVRPGQEARARELAAAVEQEMGRLGPSLVELTDFSGSQHYLADMGYGVRTATTHIVELETHRTRPRSRMKRGAVQSAQRGLSVRDLGSEAELERCYRLLQERDREFGQATKYPIAFLRGIWQGMAARGLAQFRVAAAGQRIAGFMINLLSKQDIIYWDGASGREDSALRPADALYADAIGWGLANGYRRLNLGGSPPGAGGLVSFKERWGGKPYIYRIYSKKTWWYKSLERLRR